MSAMSLEKESLKTILQVAETETTTPEADVKTNENVIAANDANLEVSKIKADAPKFKRTVKPHNKKAYAFFNMALPPMFGILLFLGLWTLLSHQTPVLPGPLSTFKSAIDLFAHPFYVNSLDDQGIGWNILASLERVAVGFGLAALVGIPLGFMIGRYEFMSRMCAPVIGLLRPVSPLAWLPLGLLVLKAAAPAAIWVIFISSIWPMLINTAVGVSKVPQDYMNVAKVLNLSEWKIITKISFPYVLPYMMTGVRLSMGIAWLVIVAAEMLNGGAGIGFWLWDEYNASNYEHIIIAIIVVGIIGLILEQTLIALAKRFNYE
ncbi:MAG TPA: nitrate ABC transporter permease [Methylotenera sp.]|nr:nitrate ABC transporter permease [Methylotenera sp.]